MYQCVKYPQIFVNLPIGRWTRKLLLRSRNLSRGRSPILGGRLTISLHPASNSARDVILPSSSGNEASLLWATSKVCSGSLHTSRGNAVNWLRLFKQSKFFIKFITFSFFTLSSHFFNPKPNVVLGRLLYSFLESCNLIYLRFYYFSSALHLKIYIYTFYIRWFLILNFDFWFFELKLPEIEVRKRLQHHHRLRYDSYGIVI